MRMMVRLLGGVSIAVGAMVACGPTKPDPPSGYTKIDAFTSASRVLKVDSVTVYDTFAVVFWWEYWKDSSAVDAYRIEYGLSSDSLKDTLNLKGYTNQVNLVDTIHPLLPGTAYYARFYREFNRGEPKITPFQFTTRATESAVTP